MMKVFYKVLPLQVLIIILAIFKFGNAQIIINSGPEVTPIDMVESILGEGVNYSNVTFQGADVARGIFSNGSSTNMGIESGIILTSGYASIVVGPNINSAYSNNNGMPGHPLLTSISTFGTYDASVLEFDFIPESELLRFKYVLGSEEYSERVGSAFNDCFGCFISGPNPAGGNYEDKNIAIVPGTVNTSVTINNINNGYASPGEIPVGPCQHCEYFSDNTGGMTLEYDAFTTVLTAWLLVVPCEEYHMTIGIADAGDHIYDSGVFIKENSFTSPKIDVETDPYPEGVSDNMIEGCVEADIIFRLPSPDYAPITVSFEVGGYADPSAFDPDGGDFYEAIPTEITFEEDEDSVSIYVNPVYDGIIEGEETLELVIENTLGCIVRYDTVIFTIFDYVEMLSEMSPNTMICSGQEIELWVNTYNGFPPYWFEWEEYPDIYNDTIWVSPDTSNRFFVDIIDLCRDTITDSVQVTVFPVCELETFYFESFLNPGLPYDVFGNVMGDTVFIVFPPGTNLNGLIPSFTFSNEECSNTVGTITDFTEPLVYQFVGPAGCISEWIVIADVEVGQNELLKNGIQIFPNPAGDQISIRGAKGWNYTMVNNLGINQISGSLKDENYTVDISHLNQGVYYFRFQNGLETFVRKVIINK